MVDVIKPQSARFGVPYDDGLGNEVEVSYDEADEFYRGYVAIKDAGAEIRIPLKHVEWLTDALRSVGRIAWGTKQ